MPLAMSRPYRHPKTGIFWFRKGVPEAIRELVGKREEKFSLRTREPAEAKIAHARALAEVEARWKSLTEGVQSLSHRQAEAIAGLIYKEMVESHDEEPQTAPYPDLIMDRTVANLTGVTFEGPQQGIERAYRALSVAKATRNKKAIDAWLSKNGMILTSESRIKLNEAVERAVLQAREQLARMSKGDYRPDPDADRFPKLERPTPAPKSGLDNKRTSPLAIFDAYAKESQIKERTIKRWRPILEKVNSDIPDLSKMTKEWVIEWKDRLIESGLATKTVNENYLAALKATCNWAVINGRIEENFAKDVSIKVRKTTRLREKGFTDEEAQTILHATGGPYPPKLSDHYKSARRWVPWLCAYTGARVGEIGQLRKQDIQERKGIAGILITPEAGTVKTDIARWVPLHPCLIEQGFLQWIDSQKGELLFLNAGLLKNGKTPPAERVGQHLAGWVREIGVDDPRVQPNHGWRHRFKTLARRHDIPRDIADHIQGHASATSGDAYGDFPPDALLREIKKLPSVSP